MTPKKVWKWATRDGYSPNIQLWSKKPTLARQGYQYQGKFFCMVQELKHFNHDLKPNECREIVTPPKDLGEPSDWVWQNKSPDHPDIQQALSERD